MARILVVEDDLAINDLITMNLQVAGYECDSAFDGAEAIAAIGRQVYDLALLDVMLPEKDGFELIPYMQERSIPVIYVSAKADVADRIKGLRLGAEDYIIKPFDILELMVRAEKVIERSRPAEKVYTICGATIDEGNHTVMVDGEYVDLQPLEFQLMVMFARHPGMVFSREQLLNAVWGDEFFGETRTVDVHIAAIRKKLGWNDAIQTVHRIGYRLRKVGANP